MSVRPRLTMMLALGLGSSLTTCGEPPPAGPRVYEVDLAEEIPMTGSPQPLFSEVDVVMRQFLKWRCGGAAVVAVAYRGRRVYKRGFGRMHGRANEEVLLGCPDDELDPFDPDAPLVQPDTPLLIGSLSKPITAAVARWLVDERASERGVQMPPCEGDFCSCEEPPCPATAADIPILHPQMDLLPEHIAEIMRGDVPLPVVDEEEGPCVEGADPEYADPRWANVTLGQLISHQSGLPRGGVSWSDSDKGVIANIAALRGYGESPDESVWQHEYDVLREAYPQYADAMEQSRAWLSGLHGGAPVYFVNKGNAVAGYRLWDEHLMLSLNRCHDYNPGPDNYYNHDDGLYDSIDTNGSYSNLAYDIVGRINDHLQQQRTGQFYMAEYGDLDSHWGSALEEYFRAELDIEGGVETPEGIFNYQLTSEYRAPQDHPTPRFREADEPYHETKSLHRPYCVMSDGECSFGPWASGRYSGANVRAHYDFAPPEDESAGFEELPAWRHNHSGTSAAGGIVVEAPIYLRFARDHRISGSAYEVDNGNGAPRDWTRDGAHGGSLGGGRAYVLQLKHQPRLTSLPPVVDGHLVDDFVHTRSRLISVPDDVDFFVAVNQREDSRCVREPWEDSACSYEYGAIHRFMMFALTEVDWDAVAAQIDAESETIVAMAVDPQGVAHYWYADDMHLDSGREPASFEGRATLVEGLPPDSTALASYRLPSTRIGPDVLGVAMDGEGVVHAWYTDGRVSTGTARDLSDMAEPVRFEAAPEPSRYDITAIAIDSGGTVHTWYADGTRAEGSVTELAAGGLSSYAVPQGYTHADLVTATIERGAGPDGADRVWARYADGHVSSGTVDDLGAYD